MLYDQSQVWAKSTRHTRSCGNTTKEGQHGQPRERSHKGGYARRGGNASPDNSTRSTLLIKNEKGGEESTAIRPCSSQDGSLSMIREESCTLDFKQRALAKGKLVFISSLLHSTFSNFLCTSFVFPHCMFEIFKIVFCMLEFFLAFFLFYKKTKNIF